MVLAPGGPNSAEPFTVALLRLLPASHPGTRQRSSGAAWVSAYSVVTFPPGEPSAGDAILPPQDGFLFLDREKFHESFAGDLSADEAAFMADSQVPWGVECLAGTIGEPAWRSKPSWYLVATEDRMIPPPAQRSMSERAGSTVEEAAGSHSIYVSRPDVVADLIRAAVSANV
jgi:pimeloyl-ACP methyl ester carboxylesterase